jgi:hypothetical protein
VVGELLLLHELIFTLRESTVTIDMNKSLFDLQLVRLANQLPS